MHCKRATVWSREQDSDRAISACEAVQERAPLKSAQFCFCYVAPPCLLRGTSLLAMWHLPACYMAPPCLLHGTSLLTMWHLPDVRHEPKVTRHPPGAPSSFLTAIRLFDTAMR